MAHFEVIMPKLGESIEEATIIRWFVKPGDKIKEDDVLLEIATDKVDSEIPSPVEGIVSRLLYKQDDLVPVGSVIAVIDLDAEANVSATGDESSSSSEPKESAARSETSDQQAGTQTSRDDYKTGMRFYSPLVLKIAQEENISAGELNSIPGSGKNGRVQKRDVMAYLDARKKDTGTSLKAKAGSSEPTVISAVSLDRTKEKSTASQLVTSADEIIQMDRMRKLIAEHMIRSKQVSAHVTNMVEVDATPVVNWRNRVKDNFEKKEGFKLTYLPVFLDSVVKALKDFPMINSSVEGDSIIVKKRINLGIAVALPDYNLIVPVIKNADNLNISGLAREINRLANAARTNKLKPDEIQDGTFTITNFGSFRNTIGTPIINQPQVAILAIGTIEKKPAVIETDMGDVIAIRHKMFLSLTYDHRIIDGALGGAFLRKLGDYIESFDVSSAV